MSKISEKAFLSTVISAEEFHAEHLPRDEEKRRYAAIVSLFQGAVLEMKKVGPLGSDSSYRSDNGATMKREDYVSPKSGNSYTGVWVLRNPENEVVDFDRYRLDLAERNCLKLANTLDQN